MKPSEILKSKELCKGMYFTGVVDRQEAVANPDKVVGCCIMGLFILAGTSFDDEERLRDAIQVKEGHRYITVYNDNPKRTKEEVVELLESIEL